MAGTTTVVLGGGFGGLSTANTLRPLLGSQHRILLIDRMPDLHVGAGKTWVALAGCKVSEISCLRKRLLLPGIEQREAMVSRIDIASRTVQAAEENFHWDHLVIALGADLNMTAVPGLAAVAHTYYSIAGAERLRDALGAFSGGEIVLLNPKMPIKCPAAPYEMAMLLHHALVRRELRDRTRISIHTVEPAPMPTGGPQIGQFIRSELEQRGIAFHPQRQIDRVDPAARSLVFKDGSVVKFDLLVAIPVHEAPKVVRDAGLVGDTGWIPADPKILLARSAPPEATVFAIGDVNAVRLPGSYKPDVPLAMPKAGVIAAAQGEIVARRIAALVGGREPTATFDGRGYCFLEVGGGRAVKAEGSFFELPHPVMQKGTADEAHLQEKHDWVARMLAPRT